MRVLACLCIALSCRAAVAQSEYPPEATEAIQFLESLRGEVPGAQGRIVRDSDGPAGRIIGIDLGRCEVVDGSIFRRLAPIQDAKDLSLHYSTVTDEALSHVPELKGLRSISLLRVGLTGEGCASWRTMGNLESVRFVECRSLCENGMRNIGAITSLTRLEVSCTNVDDAGIAHLSGLLKLHSLELGGTQLTDAGLAHLGKMESITELGLSSTRITDEGILKIRHLPISVLRIGHTDVSDRSVDVMLKMPSLRSIVIRHSRITDQGVWRLAHIRQLESLGVHTSQMSDATRRLLESKHPDIYIRVVNDD